MKLAFEIATVIITLLFYVVLFRTERRANRQEYSKNLNFSIKLLYASLVVFLLLMWLIGKQAFDDLMNVVKGIVLVLSAIYIVIRWPKFIQTFKKKSTLED